MTTAHYMRLLTDVELNDHQKHIWYRCVEKFLGVDEATQRENFLDTLISHRDELEGDDKFPFVYVVYLSHDIDRAAAEQIVFLWGEIYPRDFEIESSAEYDDCDCEGDNLCSCNEIEIDDEMHEEIQRRASKFLHNRWVEEQVNAGWRYGINNNSNDMTDPKLRDWDNLREEYRREITLTRDQATRFFRAYSHLFF